MKTRVTLIAAGVLTMAYAVFGAFADPDLAPGGVLVFVAAVLVGHDAIWMAAVLAAGAVVTRFVPARHRSVASTAAISAAAVTVVALPLVLGHGQPADNPSALPLPYGRNLAAVLLLILAATLLTRPWRMRRRRAASGHTAGRKNSERSDAGGPEPHAG